MAVGTPYGHEQWKNVEITGYGRVLSADSDSDHLDWYVRGGSTILMFSVKVQY